jgi:hypothetical protein
MSRLRQLIEARLMLARMTDNKLQMTNPLSAVVIPAAQSVTFVICHANEHQASFARSFSAGAGRRRAEGHNR